MKRMTLTLSIVALLIFQGSGFAQQKGQERQKNKEQVSDGQTPQKRGGPANPRMDRGNRGPGQLDPAAMIARMLKEFDTDGDEKLDLKELTKLVMAMRERRQAGGQAGFRDRAAGMDQRDNGRRDRPTQGRRGQTPATGEQGGDKPVRPTGK